MKDRIGTNRSTLLITALIAFTIPTVLSGCSNSGRSNDGLELPELTAEQGEHERDTVVGREGEGEHGGERAEGEHGREGSREGRGEHGGERGEGEGEHGGEGEEGGEESGTEYGLNDTCDNVRNGARLILRWDAESSSFVGTVENTTDAVLRRVRVEVHLSNGIELGPTTPADIEAGQKRRVRLTVTSIDFEAWSAHPEVGSGDDSGEHD